MQVCPLQYAFLHVYATRVNANGFDSFSITKVAIKNVLSLVLWTSTHVYLAVYIYLQIFIGECVFAFYRTILTYKLISVHPPAKFSLENVRLPSKEQFSHTS